MTVYHHIVANNPTASEGLWALHGYDCNSEEDGVAALHEIAMGSDDGFKQVMELHPINPSKILMGTIQDATVAR